MLWRMFRKKLLILVSVGVVLPLLILTYLQYRSLTELQNKTKGAFKDNLRQGLPILEQVMKRRLQDIADQTLTRLDSMNLSSLGPPEAGIAKELENYFAVVKRSHPEIEEIFVVGYSGDQEKANTYAYAY